MCRMQRSLDLSKVLRVVYEGNLRMNIWSSLVFKITILAALLGTILVILGRKVLSTTRLSPRFDKHSVIRKVLQLVLSSRCLPVPCASRRRGGNRAQWYKTGEGGALPLWRSCTVPTVPIVRHCTASSRCQQEPPVVPNTLGCPFHIYLTKSASMQPRTEP